MVRWAPSRNPSVILNNKDPPALPPRRIRFPGNHLLLLEAIARHNGQVIHPLRLLARETTTAPGRYSSSPSPSLRFRVVRCLGRKRGSEEGEGERERDSKGGEKRLETYVHTILVRTIFRPRLLLYASLEIAIDRSRKLPRSPRKASPPLLLPLPPAGMLIAKQSFRLLTNELRLLREIGRIV